MAQRSARREQLLGWLKDPKFWVSLFSLAVSLVTLYLVYLNPGKLQIYLADHIALLLNEDSSITLSVPTVFYNTASPNRWHIVRDVNADVDIYDRSGSVENIRVGWSFTHKLMGKLEFEHSYPELKQARTLDYFVYDSRKLPFSVSGRQTVSKIFTFEPSQPLPRLSAPFRLGIRLEAITVQDRSFASSKKTEYEVSEDDMKEAKKSRVAQWISRKPSRLPVPQPGPTPPAR